MELLFEILKAVSPALLTGIFTFLITKYTYNKNKPLDKLEISYDKVYYPLYSLIKNQEDNEDIDSVIDKAKIYLNRNEKYVDESTFTTYKSLCVSKTKVEKKNAYKFFKKNIYEKNSYLRRRLGYLDSNFIQSYRYSTPLEKSLFRITIYSFLMYVAFEVCKIISDRNYNGFALFFVTGLISFIMIVCEIVWCVLRILYYKYKK